MLDWRIATVIAVLVSRDWKLEWSLSSGPWEVQTSTRAGLGFRAGVKDYRLTYLQGYRYGLTCRFPSLEYHLRAATPWNAPILNTYLPTSVEVVSCKPEVYAEKWAGMEVRASLAIAEWILVTYITWPFISDRRLRYSDMPLRYDWPGT